MAYFSYSGRSYGNPHSLNFIYPLVPSSGYFFDLVAYSVKAGKQILGGNIETNSEWKPLVWCKSKPRSSLSPLKSGLFICQRFHHRNESLA